jgi:hypothetical protein
VGEAGTILEFDPARDNLGGGKLWYLTPAVRLNGIWGSSKDDLWVVGDAQTLLHYDHGTWTVTAPPAGSYDLTATWGRDNADIFAVGTRSTVLHRDATGWTSIGNATTSVVPNFLAVHGSATETWLVGDSANAIVLGGSTATQVPLPGIALPLRAVGVVSTSEVWIAGAGKVARVLGTAHDQLGEPCDISAATGISATPSGEVWMVSSDAVAHAPPGDGCKLSAPPFYGAGLTIAANSATVWVAGLHGMLKRGLLPRLDGGYDNPRFDDQTSAPAGGLAFEAVWGSTADDVWIAGHGQVFRWNGKTFESPPKPSGSFALFSISGDGHGKVAGVGYHRFLAWSAGALVGDVEHPCVNYHSAAVTPAGQIVAISGDEAGCIGEPRGATGGVGTLWSWSADVGALVPAAPFRTELSKGYLWSDGVGFWVVDGNSGDLCRCTLAGCDPEQCLPDDSRIHGPTSIAGSSATDIWVGTWGYGRPGDGGEIYHCTWASSPPRCLPQKAADGVTITGIWAGSGTAAWAVGTDGRILSLDGTWSPTQSGTTHALWALGGVPNLCGGTDLWAVGSRGIVLHRRGR